MKRLGREHKTFWLDRRQPPAVEVEPGELLLAETTESFDGQIDLSRPRAMRFEAGSPEGLLDPRRAVPLTGPIYVRGAEPGDVLLSEIESIACRGHGFSAFLPDFDALYEGKEAAASEHWTVRVMELGREKIHFHRDLWLPYAPMVGALGVAPAGEPADSATPGAYGGNHNCARLGEDSRLYLHVRVPGALVSLGDLHASMGDGEWGGTAVECAGEVGLRFQLHKGRPLPGPILETADDWLLYGWGRTAEEAIQMAVDHTLGFLVRQLEVSLGDAYLLLAGVCHIRLNQLVNPSRSARVEVPKHVAGEELIYVAGRVGGERLSASPALERHAQGW